MSTLRSRVKTSDSFWVNYTVSTLKNKKFQQFYQHQSSSHGHRLPKETFSLSISDLQLTWLLDEDEWLEVEHLAEMVYMNLSRCCFSTCITSHLITIIYLIPFGKLAGCRCYIHVYIFNFKGFITKCGDLSSCQTRSTHKSFLKRTCPKKKQKKKNSRKTRKFRALNPRAVLKLDWRD